MLHPFSYLSPRSKEEALAMLGTLPGAALIAGGTDIVVRMRRGEAHDHLIDVAALPEMAGIEAGSGRIRIGAGVTHARIAADRTVRKACAGLALACSQVGSPQIRYMGTLGGNLANASPAADSLAPLLIHNAQATVESSLGARTEAIEQTHNRTLQDEPEGRRADNVRIDGRTRRIRRRVPEGRKTGRLGHLPPVVRLGAADRRRRDSGREDRSG